MEYRKVAAGIALVFCTCFAGLSQTTAVKQVLSAPPEFCISEAEWKLYRMVNEYRRQYDLPPIPLSRSLCFVASTHVKDLNLNHPDKGPCNSHSWSDKGPWKPFCYPKDEDKKNSVWDKPKELSSYNSKGYEIIYWENSAVVIDSVIAFWKSIDYFNGFLMNTGKWQGRKWNAIGIAIFENYASAWFGEVPDPEGAPNVCGREPVIPAARVPDSSAGKNSAPTDVQAASPKPKPPQASSEKPFNTVPGKYYVIVKSQLPLEASEKLAASLREKGYPDAKVIEGMGKVRVSIFEALTRDEANLKLAEAKKLYRDSWILVP
jgi:hypothetical protein